MNIVMLIGRITKDLELRKTQNQKSYVKFSLAVDRQGDGADFIDCTAWGKTAENMVNYLGKGAKIAASGRIQTDSYTNREGQKVYTTTVVCSNVEFCERRKGEEQEKQNDDFSLPETVEDADLPWE